ncbi:hypothetical protein WM40_04395 [Robbsia andropogonis]|uniref:Tat pathway signal protein n=1 Tax=Robbsia andropogonis TaxID=28092 RepID=A0A0F5K3J7_9BURK|nr:hypothetical protein [Robbsia andropogonis]KKB64658.1 hypothetical protein WM40_04395 [Robbsia andropogonis]MCP1117833.1 hypothetical protein [Robbsia andropogonis]MCP1127297.1 hypothetical protein [Robbsia andropogonis]
MTSRRTFIRSTSVAAALPVIASTAGISKTVQAASAATLDADLKKQMLAKLTTELNDAHTAAIEVPYLHDIFFSWDLPFIPAAQISSIIAFSFGDRPGASTPLPGPINEAIADAVNQLYTLKPVMVYAQAEVASVLTTKYGMSTNNLQSVHPPAVASSGKVTYPTLDDVAVAILALKTNAAALGTVGVITHRDQTKRAIQTCTAHGMTAYAPNDITLPRNYDPHASQPTRRRRDLFLLNDMANQFASLRLQLITEEYPNG